MVDLSGCSSITLNYDIALDDYDLSVGDTDGSEQMAIECSPDNGFTWYTMNAHSDGGTGNDLSFNWTGYTGPLNAACLTNQALIRFRASGVDTFYIDGWGVDTVELI